MVQLIALVIFLISILGISVILYKKIPVLVQLPQNGYNGLKKPKFISAIERKIKEHHFNFFEKQMLLHKFLSKLRVFILKIEKRIDLLLCSIREKAQELDKKIKDKK
jgi:hypothetical protein